MEISFFTNCKFSVNGIDAVFDDFGSMLDDNWSDPDFPRIRFAPLKSTKVVLEKYNISEDDYQEVCDILYAKY